jgi:lipoate---protein ligase
MTQSVPHSPIPWRLIPPLCESGRVQMALDSWLLEQHRLGLHPPTLRFYTWLPAAISLGYHQKRFPEHWQVLTWQGGAIELVRRPTGGRAVLHQGDLTYAVVMTAPKGRRIEVYRRICEFLIEGWRSLGIELHYGKGDRSYIQACNCFASATEADLVTATGQKFIGSAQLRRGNAVLQHGSMAIDPDGELFARAFDTPVKPVVLPFAPQGKGRVDTAIEVLTAAAHRCFGVELVTQPLSPTEWQAVYELSALADG